MVTKPPILSKSIPEILQAIEAQKERAEFMSTGIFDLDEQLDGGFLRKELIVIGAFTGYGKSYLGGQLLLNIARKGFKCAYISLEIANEMVVARMLGSISGIKPSRIHWGLLSAAEVKLKEQAKAELGAYSEFLHFYDNIYTLDEIVRAIKENGYEFTVVDFIQNVISKGEEEHTRLTRTALELQKTAKEVDGTILALSQLSNAVAREGDKTPILSYKGSGSIATVCDLGFTFTKGDPNFKTEQTHPIKLTLAKNRRGISGTVFNLYFKVPGGKIYDKET